MVQALVIELPAVLNESSLDKRIKANLDKAIKDYRSDTGKFPEHVIQAMPTVVKEQVKSLLERDYGTRWDMSSPYVHVLSLPGDYADMNLTDVTTENVSEIGRYLVDEIFDAIDTSCRLVGSAASALATQGFPQVDALNRTL